MINNEQPQPQPSKDSKELTPEQKADLQRRLADGEFDLDALRRSLGETLQSPPAINPANPVEVPPGKKGSKYRPD